MNGIRIEEASLSAAARELNRAYAQISGELDRLQQTLDTLSARWTGDAQAAYVRAQTQWAPNMARMAAVVNGAGNEAERVASAITQLEQKLAQQWP